MTEKIEKTPYVEEVIEDIVAEELAEEQDLQEAELDIELQIVERVSELVSDIETSRLSRWLTTINWEQILGEAWAHHPTVEDKAKALAMQARCDIRPKIARAGQ